MKSGKNGHNILDHDRLNRYRAMKLVTEARHFIDLQRTEKEYAIEEEQAKMLLDLHAEILSYEEKGGEKILRLEYEGVHFFCISNEEMSHPHLPPLKKAGS